MKKNYRPNWADFQILGLKNYDIGDTCEVRESYEYHGDWARTDLLVVGICWINRTNEWEVLCRHDGDQFTEFGLEDLWKKIF